MKFYVYSDGIILYYYNIIGDSDVIIGYCVDIRVLICEDLVGYKGGIFRYMDDIIGYNDVIVGYSNVIIWYIL